MFSLPEFTKVKVLDVTVLSQKNRPAGANPGVRLNVQADLPNYVLSEFDPALRNTLFQKSAAAETAKDKRQTLPGVEPISDLPNLTSLARHIKKVAWSDKLSGYDVEIDHGIGGKSNLKMGDATLENFRFAAKEGGTVAAWWSIEVVDVPKLVMGELTMLKSREVPMKLLEPEVKQQDLDDGAPAAAPAAPAKGAKKGAAGHKDDEPWPFPNEAPGAAQTPEAAFIATADKG
ncbi:hypothetical protein VLK31_06975 [Variovorax sp. H27-G14]|uniref:hypothetical protein n=1 Tax=Variovorax sp. H27-G14 TaxID=3111914 RepID=UPI0038FD3E24